MRASGTWLCVALGAATCDATAQFTTPANWGSTEGNTTYQSFGADARVMVIDRSNAGTSMTMTNIAFRREGFGASTRATPRTFDMTIRLGHGDFGLIEGAMDRNYRTPATVVFTTKPASLPDWTGVTMQPPAKFDFVLPFDVPFRYDGVRALVWDYTIQNSTNTTDVAADMQFDTYSTAPGSSLGPGCTTAGQTAPYKQGIEFGNLGAGHDPFAMQLRLSATGAPRFVSVFMNFALTDANQTVPGACAKLHAAPLVSAAVGTTDHTGTMYERLFAFPYDMSLQGLTLYSQMLSFDSSQSGLPLSVSDGARSTVPPFFPSSRAEKACYILGKPTDPTGKIQFGGCPIARFQ